MLHSSSTQWKHKFSLEISLEEGYVNIFGNVTSLLIKKIKSGTKHPGFINSGSNLKAVKLPYRSPRKVIIRKLLNCFKA
jgi:hypothetical protein